MIAWEKLWGLTWRVLCKPHKLSSKVLLSKYGGWVTLDEDRSARNASCLWRGLLKAVSLAKLGMKLLVGNGRGTLFWLDSWSTERLLLQLVHSQVHPSMFWQKVEDWWDSDVGWRLQDLRQWLPREEVDAMVLAVPGCREEQENRPYLRVF